MPTSRDPRIDAYIRKAAAFARPILQHVRDLVHRAAPEAEETLKWSMPYFTSNGKILCGMAAFKAHCAVGFWHQGMQRELGQHEIKADDAMGSLGRITSLADLPDDATMVRLVKRAVELNASDEPGRVRSAKPARDLAVPADLAAQLKRNTAATMTFRDFSPSQRREYITWITEAKQDETRARRLATTLEWLAEGKPRNWKYVK